MRQNEGDSLFWPQRSVEAAVKAVRSELERPLRILSELRQSPNQIEWSLKLRRGGSTNSDRYTVWFIKEAAGSVTEVLRRLQAPDQLRQVVNDDRQVLLKTGIGASANARGQTSYRLYVDSHEGPRRTYRAFHWHPGDRTATESRDYGFHHGDRTTDSQEHYLEILEQLLADCPTASRMTADWIRLAQKLKAPEGFWVRYVGEKPTQLDFIHVRTPHLRHFSPLLAEVSTLLGCDTDWIATHINQPVRHIAFALEDQDLICTIYFSAFLYEPVCVSCLDDVRKATRIVGAGKDTNAFYSDDSIQMWRRILGPGLHYHAGLYTQEYEETVPENGAAEAAERAVKVLYPYIKPEARVLDVGCGWGGPMRMLERDLNCEVLGLSISEGQVEYCRSQRLNAHVCNVESDPLPSGFDVVILLEVLTHIMDKTRLLRRLQDVAPLLIMRVNCNNATTTETQGTFGSSMYVPHPDHLRRILERSGWKIEFWQDRRQEALPSILWWRQNMASIPRQSPESHVEILRHYCSRTSRMLNEWGRWNPLIEVHARRA